MTLQGGDREFGHGDQVTVVNDSGGTLAGGTPVKVTGRAATGDHVTVDAVGADDTSDGVLADAAGDGEAIQMVSHGLVWAIVDGDVSASATVGETGDGVLGTGESDYTVYEANRTDKDGSNVALIRYEN